MNFDSDAEMEAFDEAFFGEHNPVPGTPPRPPAAHVLGPEADLHRPRLEGGRDEGDVIVLDGEDDLSDDGPPRIVNRGALRVGAGANRPRADPARPVGRVVPDGPAGTVQHRNWVFTLNNYQEGDAEAIVDRVRAYDPAAKVVIGQEVGAQGTAHLQGAVFLSKSRTRWDTIFRGLPRFCYGGAMHVEKANGDWQASYRYCTKEGGAKVVFEYVDLAY